MLLEKTGLQEGEPADGVISVGDAGTARSVARQVVGRMNKHPLSLSPLNAPLLAPPIWKNQSTSRT